MLIRVTITDAFSAMPCYAQKRHVLMILPLLRRHAETARYGACYTRYAAVVTLRWLR